MNDFVYVMSPGTLSFRRKLSEWSDEKDFSALSSKYFSDLVSNYLSFEGFYEIKDFNHNLVMLEKLEGKTLDDFFVSEYDRVNLIFPEKFSDLKKLSHEHLSLVKGQIWNKIVEGKLGKNYHTCSIRLNGK